MSGEHHISDETLLLYSDGELPPKRAEEVRAHLLDCSGCASKIDELENRLAEVGNVQRARFDSKLPPANQARSALQIRLAELTFKPEQRSEKSRLGWVRSVVTPGPQGYALAGLLLVLVLTLAIYRREIRSGSEQISASLGLWSEPLTNLTPGATVPVTRAQVCSEGPERPVPAVPASLQRMVLAEYGVKGKAPDAYEVDYLITPELGGATDIRNLWPEPYQDTAWNAHVKDQLEERLHQMVCHGDLDLATAQQDISRDWIAAYRKYFHTDQPLAENSWPHRL
jgi:hypothetical protein